MGRSTHRERELGKGRATSNGAANGKYNGDQETPARSQPAPPPPAHVPARTPTRARRRAIRTSLPPRDPLVDDVLTYGERPKDERAEDVAQVLVAVAGALLVGALYLALPDVVAFGPRWLPLVLEVLLLAPIVITHVVTPGTLLPFKLARALAMALLFVLTGTLIGSVVLLVTHLTKLRSGAQLLHPAALLWAINILVWAVWYWEIDGDGPRARNRRRKVLATDFIFPQLNDGNPSDWRPGFVDYLFLAFCCSTTLGPADTFPLTHRAKFIVMVESGLSLLIVAILISRAVGILS